MAQQQKEFIEPRYNFKEQCIQFNPYLEFSSQAASTDGGKNAPSEESIGTLLLKVFEKDRKGSTRQLFSKIQRSSKSGIWSFQGTRDLSKITREWLDTSLIPSFARVVFPVKEYQVTFFLVQNLASPRPPQLVNQSHKRNLPLPCDIFEGPYPFSTI